MYYLDENLDQNKLFENCLSDMLKEKYRGHTFYVHNLANYDLVFILKFLNPYLLKNEQYKVQLINKND